MFIINLGHINDICTVKNIILVDYKITVVTLLLLYSPSHHQTTHRISTPTNSLFCHHVQRQKEKSEINKNEQVEAIQR